MALLGLPPLAAMSEEERAEVLGHKPKTKKQEPAPQPLSPAQTVVALLLIAGLVYALWPALLEIVGFVALVCLVEQAGRK